MKSVEDSACLRMDLTPIKSNSRRIRMQAHFIKAKIRYRQADGTERNIEIGDTRYGVVFAGEQLPGGYKADGVYILLHDFYREILDNVAARPLDYDYLRDLTPPRNGFTNCSATRCSPRSNTAGSGPN